MIIANEDIKVVSAKNQLLLFGFENYFRISYAASDENLENACKRIKQFCKNLKLDQIFCLRILNYQSKIS